MWLAGPTDSTRPWSCISTSSNAPRSYIWVRCSRTQIADTWDVMPPVRCGLNVTGRLSALVGRRAHHIRHWEDGGHTELDNLVLLCPYHHRLHHRGVITITGPAHQLTVTDSDGRTLNPGSLARPPNRPPPAVAPCPGPTGERADWWWYEPFQPQASPTAN